MKKVLPLTAAALACGFVSMASAAQLYSESFSTDGPISTYVGADQVFSAVSGEASMPAVSGGKLTLGLTANVGADSLATAVSSLGGEKGLMSLKVDITPQSYSAGRITLVLSGSADVVWTGWNFGERTWATMQIDETGALLNQTGTKYPTTLQQAHTFSLFFNASGSAQNYTGPDGSTHMLADQSWSAFNGSAALAENIAKAGAPNMQYVGFLVARNWGGGQTITDIDNLVIRDDLDVYPVPEPASLGLLALSGMLCLRRRQN